MLDLNHFPLLGFTRVDSSKGLNTSARGRPILSQRCTALASGNISSFTVAGRDSLPAEPGGLVSTPLALSISGAEDGALREADRVMEDQPPYSPLGRSRHLDS